MGWQRLMTLIGPQTIPLHINHLIYAMKTHPRYGQYYATTCHCSRILVLWNICVVWWAVHLTLHLEEGRMFPMWNLYQCINLNIPSLIMDCFPSHLVFYVSCLRNYLVRVYREGFFNRSHKQTIQPPSTTQVRLFCIFKQFKW